MLDLVNAINGLDVNIAGELMPMPMPKIQNNSPTPVAACAVQDAQDQEMMSDRKFEMLKGFAQVSNSLRACEHDVLTSHSESKRTMSYCVWRRSALPSTIAFAWEGTA